MAKVVWSPRAVKDIDEIAEFIAKNSVQYARAQTKLFVEEAEELEKHPHRGRIVPELGINNIRQVLCGHYRIIYQIAEDTIGILTVHHQARLLRSTRSAAIKRYLRKK
ncbi:MAG TPA: type II toxin-antitoxin system RelE/ParE family toxin [Puia sp.]|jgi:addiction module RelE/StbE family toxin|nr:type II toxin-antitoxin system RelE/ParE family toxin [Puia sp.]